MIAQTVVFSRKTDAQRKKNLRFVPQKLRKSFANGNPSTTAAREQHQIRIRFVVVFLFHSLKVLSVNRQYIFFQSKAIKEIVMNFK